MPFSSSTELGAVPAPLLPKAEAACAWVRRSVVVASMIVGGSNLLFWVHGSVPAISFLPGMMIMRFNTAFGITAAALSLACWSRVAGPFRRRMAQCLAAITLLIGALTAAQDLAHIDFGIDTLFAPATISGDVAHAYVRHPGRMSLNAALSFVFLGLSLLCLDRAIPVGKRLIPPSPGLAILATLPVSLGVVGYLLGMDKFTGILRSTNILLHSAVTLLALCLGVLAARPDLAPMRRILSTGADGVLLRWTLPGSTFLLLALGWLIGRGRDAGLVLPGEGAALMLYGGLVLLFGLLVAASRAIARQEGRARASAEALHRSQEHSRAIFDTALDAVVLMDLDGNIADWNPSAERIFGWRLDEVIHRPLADCIIPAELRAAHNRGLAHLRATGEGPALGKRLEFPALRRDGQRFPIELSISPLPGAETYFVGFIRDITERKAAEEKLRTAKDAAESASRAKDNFVAALSHELRTPLTPVLLSAAALREDGRLPADVRTQMAMIERNVALEARLIDDLLDLTHITRGKFRLRTEPCDTHSLLSHAVEIVREDARSKSISVEVDLSAERCGVNGDPARLQQVFWNLLKNAVKFTPAGGRIRIHTRNDADQDYLVVEVTDTGLGFIPEAAERIFQPFEQEGPNHDHRFGGLGLGLAIARAIVDLHGGQIRAGSPGAGLGATFTVELPGATLAPQGMLTAEVQERPEPDENGRRRILLVEDNEPTLEVLARLLTRAGHHVFPAQNVAAARQVASENDFDLLISDLGLPDGTGLELMATLREQHPDLQAIALSGYGMEDDLRRTSEAGFAAHLVKPVDFDQLRAALRKLSSPSGIAP